eukprot:sb/3474744/
MLKFLFFAGFLVVVEGSGCHTAELNNFLLDFCPTPDEGQLYKFLKFRCISSPNTTFRVAMLRDPLFRADIAAVSQRCPDDPHHYQACGIGTIYKILKAIITVTSSDFYETSPMLRGGNRGSNTAEFKSEQCLVR